MFLVRVSKGWDLGLGSSVSKEDVGWVSFFRGDIRITMLLGFMDFIVVRNLCCVCWYFSLCLNVKEERFFLDFSSRIDRFRGSVC